MKHHPIQEGSYMKNVIHIFGASGSGTTTLGQKICEELGYTFMDTDDYFWMPTDPKFTRKRPREERIALMKRDIENAENVVISGSLVDWGDALIPYFTLAIRIEMEQALRIARLEQREKDRFGDRIAPGGDMYRQHLDFIAWAKSYDTGGMNMRSKAKHDAWQKLLSCEILHLDGANTVEEHLARVKEILDRK
jgi:adenylate kinase family enzyme